ncbi:MAG TPA: GNAT family protein [Streptosporangiaceae bacterium]
MARCRLTARPGRAAMLSPFFLEGAGVRLEPLSMAHAEALAEAAAGPRDSFRYTWVPDGLADARRYVQAALDDRDAGRSVPFAVRSRLGHRVVGSTRYLDLEVFRWPPPWPPGGGHGPVPSDGQPPVVAEIGSTWLAPAAQRTGINAEGKLLMLRHAFDVWSVLRVTLKTDARNQASRTAIERLGATFEGVRRAHSPAADGSIRDTAYYSILRPEWPAVCGRLQREVRERFA